MPQFAYKALQTDGALVEGLLEAGNRQEAMRQVQLRGLRPVRLSESAAAGKASAGQIREAGRLVLVSASRARSRRGCSRTSRACFQACWPPACRCPAPW
jgi:hypothetical protein